MTEPKSATLTFRGFEGPPDRVEALLGVAAHRLITAGDPTPNGRQYPRSVARFTLPFATPILIVDMLPQLFAHLGGVERIRSVRDVIRPEFLELDLYLPIKQSPAQESGYFSLETIRDVAFLDATIGLGLY